MNCSSPLRCRQMLAIPAGILRVSASLREINSARRDAETRRRGEKTKTAGLSLTQRRKGAKSAFGNCLGTLATLREVLGVCLLLVNFISAAETPLADAAERN